MQTKFGPQRFLKRLYFYVGMYTCIHPSNHHQSHPSFQPVSMADLIHVFYHLFPSRKAYFSWKKLKISDSHFLSVFAANGIHVTEFWPRRYKRILLGCIWLKIIFPFREICMRRPFFSLSFSFMYCGVRMWYLELLQPSYHHETTYQKVKIQCVEDIRVKGWKELGTRMTSLSCWTNSWRVYLQIYY